MARRIITVSDLSGKEVVKRIDVRITNGSTVHVLEVDESEIPAKWLNHGRTQSKRGKKTKTSA